MAQTRFLQPRLLSQLATMELRARTVVEGVMAGLHRSPFKGMSIEFAEYRKYQPGDDPSRIDWKTYARSDQYYIKQFEDETNLNACIIMDASASMGFGSGDHLTKWQYAGVLAASLAYVLQRQNDGIGLMVLDDAIRLEMQAKGTRGHLIEMIGRMEKVAPARETRLSDALHYAASKIRRRGVVIVLSDLLDDAEAVISGLQHLQFGGNDITVFHLLDPAELHFEFQGPSLFIDPETNRVVPALAEQVKETYLRELKNFLEKYSEAMGKLNILYSQVDTSQPLDQALLSFLTRSKKLK